MNLYFRNLNYRVREDDLKSLLEPYGEVENVKIVKDRDTGRSRGFGFAEMPDDNAARQAIEELNEKEFQGRQLVVNEALPRK
ncbi:MAG: RNA-binding protein [Tannerella sp.]|jgi:RNA recognition motif-containing protein|nr:RNA-binding protein [Tannerella sp.]